MKISCSEINTFLGCRLEWDYSSPNRRNRTSHRQYPALVLGKGVHEALERWYRDGTDVITTFRAWTEQEMADIVAKGDTYDAVAFAKNQALGEVMLAGYIMAYGKERSPDNTGMTVLANTEQEFQVGIPGTTDGWLVGRMDGLCRDRNGRLWVIDHKTYSTKPALLSNHFQLLAYTWAANELAQAGRFSGVGVPAGTRVYGALYNGLRKQKPGPNVTQPLFYREYVRRQSGELETFAGRLQAIHKEMASPTLAVYPTFSRNCEWCSFQEVCAVQSAGENPSWTLANQYRLAERRGSVYAEPPLDS